MEDFNHFQEVYIREHKIRAELNRILYLHKMEIKNKTTLESPRSHIPILDISATNIFLIFQCLIPHLVDKCSHCMQREFCFHWTFHDYKKIEPLENICRNWRKGLQNFVQHNNVELYADIDDIKKVHYAIREKEDVKRIIECYEIRYCIKDLPFLNLEWCKRYSTVCLCRGVWWKKFVRDISVKRGFIPKLCKSKLLSKEDVDFRINELIQIYQPKETSIKEGISKR